MQPARQLEDVEVLEDTASRTSPTEGFLRLQRLVVRNRYADGTHSENYPCDIVSRRGVDAVTVVLFQREGGRVRVGLRENLRIPVYLRSRSSEILFPDDPPVVTIPEIVAGILEPQDAQGSLAEALTRRAIAECMEEVGITVEPSAIHDLGAASFPSPGITDEKVYFRAAEVDFAAAEPPPGDGSVMEEVGGLLILDLADAILGCRDGRIPDMKTEIGLLRLRELL